jgi:hypothetical protein
MKGLSLQIEELVLQRSVRVTNVPENPCELFFNRIWSLTKIWERNPTHATGEILSN